MSRNTVIGLLVALAVIALPVVIVIAGGGDEEEPAATPIAEQADEPEVVPRQAGGPPGKGRGRRGGGPPPKTPAYEAREQAAAGNVAYPNDVTSSGEPVARAVDAVLGRIGSAKDGQRTIIGADCRDGFCAVRYVSKAHGTGSIIDDGAAILRRIFALPGVEGVRLYVHEPQGRQSDAVEPMVLVRVTCRRSRHPGFDWPRINGKGISQRCAIEEQAPGKVGSQIRRGQVSGREASRGGDTGGAGGGGATGPQKPIPPTPAERRARRKEMEELRKRRAAQQKRQVQSEQEAGLGG